VNQAFQITSEWLDHKHIKTHFAAYPKRFKPAIEKRYVELYQTQGRYAANILLLDITDDIGGNKHLLAASDDEICAYAKRKADECFRAATLWIDADMALDAMILIAVKAGINAPDKKIEKKGQRARLLCDLWWRKQIRKTIARQVEAAAIRLGLVSKFKGIYASDETVARRAGQRKRNAALLEKIIAENDSGQEYTLAELSALGVSNPEIRRMELMTRIAGFDSLAKFAGHAAEFYTLTTPSRFHAVMSKSGKPNPKYKQSTPREAQEYHRKGWALARASLAKQGIKVYGFRVVEPHHDGTPHWHMVLFMLPEHVETVRKVLRDKWMREDADEYGADEHRFAYEAIDRKKGSAVGYLVKYISKNINGKGMEDEADFQGGKVGDNATRVDAWASCWGIRQFQQIGGAPVGVWRELRRIDRDVVLEGIFDDMRTAADTGDWMAYTQAQGGALVTRLQLRATVVYQVDESKSTRYDGEGVKGIYGVECRDKWDIHTVETRWREWFLRRAQHAPAWSSVNNCNRDSGEGVKSERGSSKNSGSLARLGCYESASRRSKRGGDVGEGEESRNFG